MNFYLVQGGADVGAPVKVSHVEQNSPGNNDCIAVFKDTCHQEYTLDDMYLTVPCTICTLYTTQLMPLGRFTVVM